MNENIWSIIFSATLTKTFQVDLFMSCKLAILASISIKSVTSLMDRNLTLLGGGKHTKTKLPQVHWSRVKTVHNTGSLSRVVKGR